MEKKRIAFIRPASYPLPNKVLPEILAHAFPEYELEVIDLRKAMHSRPWSLLMNGLAVLREYGPQLLARKFHIREVFYTTRYAARMLAGLLRHINPREYAFTFQIQSLFDASTAGVPHFVYTDHTHLARLTYPNFDPAKLRSDQWIAMEKGIYQHARMIFIRSSNITQSLIEQYRVPPGKIAFAGVGANIDTVDFQPPQNRYSRKNILFVGIDWERKGGPDLLRAFERVLQAQPDATLTIVGCSPATNLPHVTTLGKLDVSQVSAYFQQASIFCLPTRMEPFGVAFIEALYYGLPIVATNIGAIPDFVRNGLNGYLVESGDTLALADRLLELLDSPEKCARFGQAGHNLAISHYSWPAVGEKLSSAIREELSATLP